MTTPQMKCLRCQDAIVLLADVPAALSARQRNLRFERHAGLAGPASVDVEHVASRVGRRFRRAPSRSDSRSTATPRMPDVQQCGTRSRGRRLPETRPRRCTRWMSSSRCCLISRANANRSYSRLMRGTDRSTNISAKYCGCSRLNSYKCQKLARTRSTGGSASSAPRSSGGRRAAGSPLRPARRRCRPCWGSSRRWRPGCIRCARRSCGSTRSGSLRDEEFARRVENGAPHRLPVSFLTFLDTHSLPLCEHDVNSVGC